MHSLRLTGWTSIPSTGRGCFGLHYGLRIIALWLILVGAAVLPAPAGAQPVNLPPEASRLLGNLPQLPGQVPPQPQLDVIDEIQRTEGDADQTDGTLPNTAGGRTAPSGDMERAVHDTPAPIEEIYSRRAGEPLRLVGYEFFGQGAPVRLRQTGAVQDSYILGIGDEVIVTLRGQVNRTESVRVNREGQIILQDLRPVAAAGRPFRDLRAEIEALAAQSFLGTNVFVSVGTVRQISVAVNGEVRQPGIHVMNGLSTVIDAIAAAGGIRKSGSLRSVTLIRGGRSIEIDLYGLMHGGGSLPELSLTEGDIVLVPMQGRTIGITGMVRRPGIYELPRGAEELPANALIELAGGLLTRGAYDYTALRIDEQGVEQFSRLERLDTQLRDGELLFVQPSVDLTRGFVELSGHVRLPRRYPLSVAETVGRLLGGYEALQDQPYLPFAVRLTLDPRTQTRRFEKFDLQAVLSGQYDLRLVDGDAVIVLGLRDVEFLISTDVIEALGGEAGAQATSCPGLAQLTLSVRSNPRGELASGQFARAARELVTSRMECPAVFARFPELLPFVLENSVLVRGNVLRPGIYPIVHADQSATILEVAGSVERSGAPAAGRTEPALAARGVEILQFRTFETAGERDRAHKGIVEVIEPRVRLEGHVRFPGTRSLAAAPSLRALIGDPQIYRETPYLLFGVVLRRNPATLYRDALPFAPIQVLNGSFDMRLSDDDIVRIFSFAEVQRAAQGPGGERATSLTPADTPEAVSADLPADPTGRGPAPPASPPGSLPPLAGVQSQLQSLTPAQAAALAGAGGGGTALVQTGTTSREAAATSTATDRLSTGEFRIADLQVLFRNHLVLVQGEVQVPGAYPIGPNVTLADVLEAIGGTTPRYDPQAVELTRGIHDARLNIVKTTRIMLDLSVQDPAAVMLQAGDSVRFNPLISDLEGGLVTVSGEVSRPGQFRITKGERLSSLLRRAGGLTETAYPFGAVFTRESVRRREEENFRLLARQIDSQLSVALTSATEDLSAEEAALLRSLSEELYRTEAVGRVVVEADPTVLQVRPELDIILEPGDQIYIPTRPYYVYVSGEVMSQGVQQFVSGRSAEDYIEAAGGYSPFADRRSVFLVLPDGRARPLKLVSWNREDVQIPPGSSIIVPRDLGPFDFARFTGVVGSVTSVLSQLAVTAASLAVIQR